MSINTAFRQQHFILYEIILPYCSVCTPSGDLTEAWHTPVTCEESSDSEYRLWLASSDAPVIVSQPEPSINIKSRLNSQIFRCVTNSSESTAKLKAGEGLASRGTMSITCTDFDGDPGPINFSDDGTFFGKLRARNILQGKTVITHRYTIAGPQGAEVIEEIGTSTHFITNTELSGGVFKLSAKDALKDIEAFSDKFPELSEVTLTADINATTTTIPVSDASSFVAGSVIRIDDELMYVNSKSGNNLTVAARGTSITNPDGTTVYKTNTSSHSTDSTVQGCYVMSKAALWDVLSDIYTALGLSDYIDYTQWQEEIQEWNSEAYLYGVFSKPESGSTLIDKLLTAYLIDMWLDQQTQKVKVSAVTAWKESIRILEEGNDISDLTITESDDKRYSRAYMYNKKEYKAEDDDITNYSKLTLSTDTSVEGDDFYGSIKVKEFENNDFISTNSAQTTTARYVQRFSKAPKTIKFTMEERKLANTTISDIVDIVSRDSQTPSGQFLQARDRAQIIRIQPSYNEVGRRYKVEALSYVPLIASNPNEELVIELSGSLFDVNLFARAGAPNIPINVTFVFNNCTIGSTAHNVPAVRAGNFEAGSRIRIICVNTNWSAKGGRNYDATPDASTGGLGYLVSISLTGDKTNGANSYVSDGIETEIYLNYGTVDGYSTSCNMYAAGGAGGIYGNFFGSTTGRPVLVALGGGGSGISFGEGGINTTGGVGLISTSGDGSFSSGGTAGGFSGAQFTLGGAGGFSVNGATGSTNNPDSRSISTPTLAGGAFKGSNITVYCLSSQLSKLRDGNSDAYTLVTA